MKRTLMLLALLAASGAASAASGTGSPDERTELLRHIPADAVAYFGYSKPFPLAEISRHWRGSMELARRMTPNANPRKATREAGPGAGMTAALYQQYMDSIIQDDYALARFGAPRKLVLGLYTVGALPVMRVAVDDPQAFWKTVDAAQKAADVSTVTSPDRGDDTSVRRYAFDGLGKDEAQLDLVIATRDGYGVFTLAGDGIGNEAVGLAIGSTLPAQSLADGDRLSRLAARYDTDKWSTGYLDHQAIMAGLTGEADTRFGRMIDRLDHAWSSHPPSPLLAEFRKPACRADMRGIAALWPETVVGTTGIDAAAGRIDSRMVVASTDASLMDEIAGLRGHVPTVTTGQPVLGLGIGLDMARVVPVLQGLAKRFSSAKFTCPSLLEAQRAVSGQSIGQLGMFAAMLGDIKGVGVAMTSLERGGPESTPVDGDGVVEISTATPETLWSMLQSALGLPANQSPSADGPPVDIPQQFLPDTRIRAAIRDNALILLAGNAGLNEAAGEPDVEPNGLLALSYDYNHLMRLVMPEMETPKGETVSTDTDAAATGASDRLYYEVTLDAEPRGFGLDIRMGPGE